MKGSVRPIECRPARSQLYPWYDSGWLTKYARAIAIIRKVRPKKLAPFVETCRVFRTRPDYQVQVFERIFDHDTVMDIKRVVAALRLADLELHEAGGFGRFVVHDHPFFTELHQRIVPLVSQAAGEPLETSYNFLSLYGARGVCPAHMDSPKAKWTLDLCVNQSAPWPLYLSQVRPWPKGEVWPDEDWEEKVKRSTSLHFTAYRLQPEQAVLFSGSSQWHYREAIPQAGGKPFCDLLFFHFIPGGTAELVRPANWARLFGIPEISLDALAEEWERPRA